MEHKNFKREQIAAKNREMGQEARNKYQGARGKIKRGMEEIGVKD